MLRRLILSLLILLSVVDRCCLADDLQAGIAAFNKGDYSSASSLLQAQVKAVPHDSVAHYYLASSYARLGQTNFAIAEYTYCLGLNNNKQVMDYARQALVTLQKPIGGRPERSTSPQDGSKGDQEDRISALTEELMKKNEPYLAPKRAELERYTKRLQQELEDGINNIEVGGAGGIGGFATPEYNKLMNKETIVQMKADTEKKIQQAKEVFDKDVSIMRAAARKKAEQQVEYDTRVRR